MNENEFQRFVRSIEQVTARIAARAPALIERDNRGGSAELDGFPGGGFGAGSRSSDRTSSTERTAVARIEHPDTHDLVHKAVVALRNHLDKALAELNAAVSQVALGEHLATHDGRHSNPPTDCLACGRTVECTTDDPIRSGFCGSCDSAWRRWKRDEQEAGRTPDRSRFARTRRTEAA